VHLFGHDVPPHEVVVEPDAQLVKVRLEVPSK
jgi:hypothetical protein